MEGRMTGGGGEGGLAMPCIYSKMAVELEGS